MTLYPAYPPVLADAEFALVRFDLDLLSPCTLALRDLLGLRLPLLAAADVLPRERRDALFAPPLSSDPAALRRFQKPAPPLVLRDPAGLPGDYCDGDRIPLEVLFLGTGTQSIGDFLVVLQGLGRRGLVRGEGRFEVVAVQGQGADGRWRRFWSGSGPATELAPPLIPVDQWLDRVWPHALPAVFELVTPARLVAGGRVLRRPRFSQLFPFLLRRVTSMLHAHCGLEPIDEPTSLCNAAARVEAAWLECRWVDWRGDGEGGGSEAVGGCVGCLRLGGGLEELLWVVLLATLLGVGKGAAYGAGQCRLTGGAS